MHNRPDRPLIVKCTLDNWHKRITFSSARNCTYGLLRHKVEQCFALSSSPYAITYKDDDGEITTITNDLDLSEAIQYFQPSDDAPLSSAASILSGRSFGSRKVTLRVHITVDYDGPSLSDTGSIVSLEEYTGRNESEQSFSFGSASVDLDDDSVTVSSRDNGLTPVVGARSPRGSNRRLDTSVANPSRSLLSSWDSNYPRTIIGSSTSREGLNKPGDQNDQPTDPSPDQFELTSDRYTQDSSDAFEHLKLQDDVGDDRSSVTHEILTRNVRGIAWLKDQNQRTIRAMLGTLPAPSESDHASLNAKSREQLGGDLALERDPRGRYYYTYTSSTTSQTFDSGYDDGLNGLNRHDTTSGNRPTSMQLNWLASQQIRRTDPKAPPSAPSFSSY